MTLRAKKGQSIVEYTLVFAVIIAALIAILFSGGGVRDSLDTAYTSTNAALNTTVNDMSTGVFTP
ncbi:hypothetical protein ACFL38_01975 [Candidatus Omnitrophota bacterium]